MKKNLAATSRRATHDKEGSSNDDDDGLSSSSSLDPARGISSITLDDLDQDLFQSNNNMGVELPSAAAVAHAFDSHEPRIENYDRAAIGERVELDGAAAPLLAMDVDVAVSSHAEKASRAEKNETLVSELEAGGTEAELGDDAGDLWRWLWDVEDSSRELQVQGVEDGCDQHQMEYMASWLLSDVF